MNERERAAAITRYAQRVTSLQETQGPFSPELAEQYLALGRLYQDATDYDSALAQYAKAEHISRMTHGLHSPEQYLPIEFSIDCHLAKGAFREALERREYLVYLYQENYGHQSSEAVPALLALGDMYLDAFERGVRRDPEKPVPELAFGPQSGFVNPQDLSPLDTAFKWLEQARTQYFTSISNLVARQDYTNPLLLHLETSLIETLFLQAFRRGIEVDPVYYMSSHEPNVRDTLSFDRKNEQLPVYREGEEAFTRILAYLRANPAVAPTQVAEAMLQLGDWHLLFGKQKRGLAQYAEARAWLLASGVDDADVAAVLNPPVPVQLPAFREQPHSRALLAPGEEPVFDGYIDVELTFDDAGQVENIEVLEKSANADDEIEARLQKVLRNAPFRPRLDDGKSAQRVALRYNFAQL